MVNGKKDLPPNLQLLSRIKIEENFSIEEEIFKSLLRVVYKINCVIINFYRKIVGGGRNFQEESPRVYVQTGDRARTILQFLQFSMRVWIVENWPGGNNAVSLAEEGREGGEGLEEEKE